MTAPIPFSGNHPDAPLRCVILDDYQHVAFAIADWKQIAARIGIERFDHHLGDADSVAERLADYDVIIAMRERTPFDAGLLARLPRLKLLVTTGMHNASIAMQAAARLGITVSGTRGVVGPAAEMTWALLLGLARHIPTETANLRAAGTQWQKSVGFDLQGKVLGIAGLGKLGKRVAGYGRAFGMRVVGWSRSNTPEISAELGIEYAASLDELLRVSDVLSLHLPLDEHTRGIVGAREFALMKRGGILLNTSRGPLVNEPALLAALQDGTLYGAGLDVFDQEPLAADHPLRHLPNVVATPHLGYVTDDTYRTFFPDALESVRAWLDGAPVRVLNG